MALTRQVNVNLVVARAITMGVWDHVSNVARKNFVNLTRSNGIVNHPVIKQDTCRQRTNYVVRAVKRNRGLRQDRPLIIVRHRRPIGRLMDTIPRGSINNVQTRTRSSLFLRFLRNQGSSLVLFQARRAIIANVKVRKRRNGAKLKGAGVTTWYFVRGACLTRRYLFNGNQDRFASEGVHDRRDRFRSIIRRGRRDLVTLSRAFLCMFHVTKRVRSIALSNHLISKDNRRSVRRPIAMFNGNLFRDHRDHLSTLFHQFPRICFRFVERTICRVRFSFRHLQDANCNRRVNKRFRNLTVMDNRFKQAVSGKDARLRRNKFNGRFWSSFVPRSICVAINGARYCLLIFRV